MHVIMSSLIVANNNNNSMDTLIREMEVSMTEILQFDFGGDHTEKEHVEENCPICFDTMTIKSAIHGCGHEFCVGCVDILRTRTTMVDNEGLGIKVIKCPMCRGTEEVSPEQLKKKVKSLIIDKNTLIFEVNDLREKCKKFEKIIKNIRGALPRANANVQRTTTTAIVNMDEDVAVAAATAVELMNTEMERMRQLRQAENERRLQQQRREREARQARNNQRRIEQRTATRQALQAANAAVVEARRLERQTANAAVVEARRLEREAATATRAAARGQARAAQEQLIGRCCVEGCRSVKRIRRKCAGACGSFCCARCKTCMECLNRSLDF